MTRAKIIEVMRKADEPLFAYQLALKAGITSISAGKILVLLLNANMVSRRKNVGIGPRYYRYYMTIEQYRAYLTIRMKSNRLNKCQEKLNFLLSIQVLPLFSKSDVLKDLIEDFRAMMPKRY
jgi:predicted transcriptional regulator